MRNTTETQIEISGGKYTTRINPLKRNSKLGFAVRRMNKLNRKSGFTVSRFYPTFLTNK